MKEKSPAVQWYPKQYLGDDRVLAMDWDARGMHHWLLNISWQQDPRGTIANDTALIRRWLSSPSDEVWRRVWPQIKDAWFSLDGRLANAGMVRAAMRQETYRKTRQKDSKTAVDEDVLRIAFDLKEAMPNWIPERPWRDFCEMRNNSKHPLTDRAKSLIITDLTTLREDGHDPGEVLNRSVKNAWRGVWAIGYGKRKGNSSSPGPAFTRAKDCRDHPDSGTAADGSCWGCYTGKPKRGQEKA